MILVTTNGVVPRPSGSFGEGTSGTSYAMESANATPKRVSQGSGVTWKLFSDVSIRQAFLKRLRRSSRVMLENPQQLSIREIGQDSFIGVVTQGLVQQIADFFLYLYKKLIFTGPAIKGYRAALNHVLP